MPNFAIFVIIMLSSGCDNKFTDKKYKCPYHAVDPLEMQNSSILILMTTCKLYI